MDVARLLPIWDVRDGLLYDRIRLEPGARLPIRMNFFQTPVGQPCPYSGWRHKTFRQTNMYSAGQLNAPCEFLAQRILFAVHPSVSETDLDLVSSEYSWEFQLLQKILARGPMLLNGPARAGLRDVVKPDGRARNPLPDGVLDTAQNFRIGAVHIPSLCYFTVEMETDRSDLFLQTAAQGGRGLDLLIAFQGGYAHPVQ